MLDRSRRLILVGLLLSALTGAGCSSDTEGAVLLVDAQFNPVAAISAVGPVNTSNGVAQSFTVINDGKLERFWLLLSQGTSIDSGTIRISIRPVVGGVPNAALGTSIITPIDVDTTTLPTLGAETFTMFDVGDQPGREVVTGEIYAMVVELVSRSATPGDGNEVVRFLGIDGSGGDPYADGTASQDAGGGYVVSPTSDDYLFRTFVLVP